MADYAVIVARSARKELEDIEALANEPRPAGCRKLKGEKFLWRIRVGDYRVIYAIYDNERQIDIITIRHRSKAYE